MPPKLLGRDNQLAEIDEKMTQGSNVYLHGGSGVGKTTTARYFLRSYPSVPNLYVRIDRSLSDSLRTALLFRMNDRTPRNKFQLMQHIARLGDPMIIVLDDFHRFYHFRSSLTDLSSFYDKFNRDKHMRFIVISQMPYHVLEQRATKEFLSRYQLHAIAFPTYSPKELEAILLQRTEGIFKHVDAEAVKFVAEKLHHLAANPRDGIDMLLTCYTKTQRVDFPTIQYAWKISKRKYWQREIEKYAKGHAALLLYLIASLCYEDRTGQTTGKQLYGKYERACRGIGITPISSNKLGYQLIRLERAGLIESRRIGLGRGQGVDREITLLFEDPQTISEAGQEISWKQLLR